MRLFDSGDLRVLMKDGSTWTFNPECCILLSEEAAATAAAAGGDLDDDARDTSSDGEDDDDAQITCRLSAVFTLSVKQWGSGGSNQPPLLTN